MSNERLEVVGIILLVAGSAGFGYGLYLLATWLLFVVHGALLLSVGTALVYRANRGGA